MKGLMHKIALLMTREIISPHKTFPHVIITILSKGIIFFQAGSSTLLKESRSRQYSRWYVRLICTHILLKNSIPHVENKWNTFGLFTNCEIFTIICLRISVGFAH